jgi:hypothetical protein
MSRFYRSTREAFPVERFPAVFGPYRRPTSALWSLLQVVGYVGTLALIGAMIGWSI